MRKILLFGFGLLLISSAFLFSSDAQYNTSCGATVSGGCQSCQDLLGSRPRPSGALGDCCDQLRRQAHRPLRAFSNRRAPYNLQYRLRSRDYLRRVRCLGGYDPTRVYKPYREPSIKSYQLRRHLHKLARPQLYPRYENNFVVGETIVRHEDRLRPYSTKPFLTRKRAEPFRAVTQGVSLDIPAGFRAVGAGAFASRDQSLKFRVVRTPESYSCKHYKFFECSVDLAKDFEHARDVKNVAYGRREVRLDRTVAGNTVLLPTYRESFIGNFLGRNYVFFVQNALDPSDNSIVRIESVAPAERAGELSQIMHNVFRSFQFDPQFIVS